MTAEELVTEIALHKGIDQLVEVLDEWVHDAKGHEASTINNSGIPGQVEYLIEFGFTPDAVAVTLGLRKNGS